MQLQAVCTCFTARTLHVFRASPAPIIRSTQTVVTTTGTGHEFEVVMTKSDQSGVAARPWTLFNRNLSLHPQTHDPHQRLQLQSVYSRRWARETSETCRVTWQENK